MAAADNVTYVCMDCEKPASYKEFTSGHCNACGGVVVSDNTGYEQEFKLRRSRKKAAKQATRDET